MKVPIASLAIELPAISRVSGTMRSRAPQAQPCALNSCDSTRASDR